jgi:hypothetical protein
MLAPEWSHVDITVDWGAIGDGAAPTPTTHIHVAFDGDAAGLLGSTKSSTANQLRTGLVLGVSGGVAVEVVYDNVVMKVVE